MSQEIFETLGKRMKAFRKSLSLSQREFANQIGYSNTYISDIETDKANPPYDFFKKLLEIYHVNLDYFFSGVGEMTLPVYGHPQELPVTANMIETCNVKTLEQLNWLIKNCPGFNHHIFGNAAEYICRNKDIVLAAIAMAEKKTEEEKSKLQPL